MTTLLSVLFLASLMLLCYVQTENLCKGETTCERFSKSSYRRVHEHAVFEAENCEMTIDQI